MEETSDARGWDMDKARLFGVIDSLHVTIDGLLAANADLTRANQQLLNANRAAMQNIADIYRLSQATPPRLAQAAVDIQPRPEPTGRPAGREGDVA
jgi:cytochrome oxidase assembly protein ShyY1